MIGQSPTIDVLHQFRMQATGFGRQMHNARNFPVGKGLSWIAQRVGHRDRALRTLPYPPFPPAGGQVLQGDDGSRLHNCRSSSRTKHTVSRGSPPPRGCFAWRTNVDGLAKRNETQEEQKHYQ